MTRTRRLICGEAQTGPGSRLVHWSRLPTCGSRCQHQGSPLPWPSESSIRGCGWREKTCLPEVPTLGMAIATSFFWEGDRGGNNPVIKEKTLLIHHWIVHPWNLHDQRQSTSGVAGHRNREGLPALLGTSRWRHQASWALGQDGVHAHPCARQCM